MNRPQGLVVGTAGHIDHGKTSLIRALTGIDTDRLAEEKKRGISIDLGFAHLTLSNGTTIGFIDVPGHERFIRNMLAGVGGIQSVMLVVAADESVMPQTREHFEICRLLNIQSGFVVVTKTDIASQEQIAIACEDIVALCAGSFLEGKPVIQVSSATGAGLSDVVEELTRLTRTVPLPQNGRIARLPIDRSFTLKGFGTVATGTLWGGELRSGDDILIHPSRIKGRIRSMQVHGNHVEFGSAGQRTAINLAGVESSAIHRGDTLTLPENIEDSHVIDAWTEWLDDAEIPATRTEFLLHIGTAEVPVEVKLLHSAVGMRAFARFWVAQRVLSFPGDRFVLRRPSPPRTVAGGQVVDAFPRLRLSRSKTLSRLERLAQADDAGRLEILVEESPEGRHIEDLLRLIGLDRIRIRELVLANPNLMFIEASGLILTKTWLGERRRRLLDWLAAYHDSNPSRPGAPLPQARLGLSPELAGIVFAGFSAVRLQGDLISLATHKALFSEEDSRALSRIENTFRNAGFQPPALGDAISATALDPKKGRALLEVLIKGKRLVRVSDDLIFHAEVMAHVKNALAAHKGRRFTVPEFKEWTQMSRKFAIPVLEYLDHERVTRREGDKRLIL